MQTSISLEKTILPGSYRWIGQRVANISTLDVPIGADEVSSILSHTGGTAYRVGRINLHNAVMVERNPLRLLYVRPSYSGYRRAALKVFPSTLWDIHFDHALGRKIADSLGFNYVLLIRLTPRANSSHGRYEQFWQQSEINRQNLCFADRRIVDKWLGRPVRRFGGATRYDLYKLGISDAFGLTLKQAGVWGYAMGVEDSLQPLPAACSPI